MKDIPGGGDGKESAQGKSYSTTMVRLQAKRRLILSSGARLSLAYLSIECWFFRIDYTRVFFYSLFSF